MFFHRSVVMLHTAESYKKAVHVLETYFGLDDEEESLATRKTTVHTKPPKQASPAARFATHRCPRAPRPVSTTLEGEWHPGASGRGPSARTIGSHMAPSPS